MSLQLGSASVNVLNIGNINIIANPSTSYKTITVTEDITDPLGQRANIKISDRQDALGSSSFRGSSELPVTVNFNEYLLGDRAGFDLRVFEGADLNDANQEEGNGRVKTYDIKCVSPEYLKNLDNQMERSYEDYTTTIVEKILKDYLETDKEIEIQEQSTTMRSFRFSRSPMEAIKALNQEHVGTESRSSAFLVFQQQRNGRSKYLITTFEKLFQQAPVTTLYRSSRVNFSSATFDESFNSIIQMNVDTAFFSPNRFLTSSYDRSYNFSTGVLADRNNRREDIFQNEERRAGRRIMPTIYDAINERQNITTAEARVLRAYFISRVSENYAEFTIHGNPKIALGDMVNLQIPNISAQGGSREELFSGKALVVSIMHHIAEPGYNPQYTMTLGCVRVV